MNRTKYFFSLLLITVPVSILIIALLKLGEVTSPTVAGLGAIVILLGFLPLFDFDSALLIAVVAGIVGLCVDLALLVPISLFSDSFDEFRTVAEPVLILFIGQGLLFGFVGGGAYRVAKRLKKLQHKVGNLFNEDRNS